MIKIKNLIRWKAVTKWNVCVCIEKKMKKLEGKQSWEKSMKWKVEISLIHRFHDERGRNRTRVSFSLFFHYIRSFFVGRVIKVDVNSIGNFEKRSRSSLELPIHDIYINTHVFIYLYLYIYIYIDIGICFTSSTRISHLYIESQR